MKPSLLALVTAAGLVAPHAASALGPRPAPATTGETRRPPAPSSTMGETPKPPAPSSTMGETPKPPAPPAEGGGAPPAVVAPATIPSEVMILHATNDSSGIDPQLGKITALSKPPFSSYNSYHLLGHSAQPLARGLSSLFNLPTGRQLQLVYKDIVPAQKHGTSPRYLISASIQSPNGKTFLPRVEVKANPGEWFWVGGQEYRGGVLFIGIKIP